MLFVASAFAGEPEVLDPDTVANIENPLKVIVTENGQKTEVKVEGTSSQPDYRFLYSITKETEEKGLPTLSTPFMSRSHRHYPRRETVVCNDMYFGIVTPYDTPEPFRTSIEYGVREFLGYRYTPGGGTASFGLGVGAGNMKLFIRRHKKVGVENDMFELTDAPEGARNVHSHLMIWRLHVPFYYRQRIHRSFGFKISATMNFNVAAKAKTSYRLDDEKHTLKVKGLHQRLLTPDFTFAIGDFDAFSVYVRWSPVSVFKHRFGPEIKTLSFGLSMGL